MAQDKEENVLIIGAPEGPPKDHPWDLIIEQVAKHASLGRLCYQKFTCSNCGQRLTMETPNHFHALGSCYKCGHITNIKETGCNFLLEMHNMTGLEVAAVLRGSWPQRTS